MVREMLRFGVGLFSVVTMKVELCWMPGHYSQLQIWTWRFRLGLHLGGSFSAMEMVGATFQFQSAEQRFFLREWLGRR